jgi:peptidoglycan/LPS O-acetylase OafA/YrhL
MMRFMASMTALLSNPSARLVGIFSAVAAILLAAGAFIINANEDAGFYGFLAILGGMTALVMALALFALRVLNRMQGPAND